MRRLNNAQLEQRTREILIDREEDNSELSIPKLRSFKSSNKGITSPTRGIMSPSSILLRPPQYQQPQYRIPIEENYHSTLSAEPYLYRSSLGYPSILDPKQRAHLSSTDHQYRQDILDNTIKKLNKEKKRLKDVGKIVEKYEKELLDRRQNEEVLVKELINQKKVSEELFETIKTTQQKNNEEKRNLLNINEKQLGQFRARLDQSELEIQHLRSVLAEETARRHNLELLVSEYRDKESECSAKDQEISELKKELTNMSGDVEKINMENLKLANKLSEIIQTEDQRSSRMRQELDFKESELASLRGEINIMENSQKQLQANYSHKESALEEEISKLQKDILRFKSASLEGERKTQEICHLQSLLSSKDEEISTLQSKYNKMKKHISVQEEELSRKTQKMIRDLDNSRAEIETLKRYNASLLNKLEHQEEQPHRPSLQLQQVLQQLETKDHEIGLLWNELRNYVQDGRRLKELRSQIDSQIIKLRDIKQKSIFHFPN